jgi:hypothetical protein
LLVNKRFLPRLFGAKYFGVPALIFCYNRSARLPAFVPLESPRRTGISKDDMAVRITNLYRLVEVIATRGHDAGGSQKNKYRSKRCAH